MPETLHSTYIPQMLAEYIQYKFINSNKYICFGYKLPTYKSPWPIGLRTLGPRTLSPRHLKSLGPRGRGPEVRGMLGPRPLGPWDFGC